MTHLERLASQAIKDGQIKTRSASPESERHAQVVSRCECFPRLSLISILGETLLDFAGSTGMSLTGGKAIRFSFWNGVSHGTPVWICLVSGLEIDFT